MNINIILLILLGFVVGYLIIYIRKIWIRLNTKRIGYNGKT